jgi:hypothetical protein
MNVLSFKYSKLTSICMVRVARTRNVYYLVIIFCVACIIYISRSTLSHLSDITSKFRTVAMFVQYTYRL